MQQDHSGAGDGALCVLHLIAPDTFSEARPDPGPCLSTRFLLALEAPHPAYGHGGQTQFPRHPLRPLNPDCVELHSPSLTDAP